MSLGQLPKSPTTNNLTAGTTPAFSFGKGLGFGAAPPPPPPPSNPVQARIQRLKDSYDTNSLLYRFQAIFYNTKSTTGMGSFNMAGKSSNPPSVTPEEWNQATADAPNPNMVPALVQGFQNLSDRRSSQQAVVKAMQDKLEDMRNRIENIKNRFNDYTAISIQDTFNNNHEISRTMMRILQIEEVKTLQNYPFSHEEQELLDKLERLHYEVHQPNKFISALNTLKLKANLQKDSMVTQPTIEIDKKSVEICEEILLTNNDGIEALGEVCKNIENITSAIEKQIEPQNISNL